MAFLKKHRYTFFYILILINIQNLYAFSKHLEHTKTINNQTIYFNQSHDFHYLQTINEQSKIKHLNIQLKIQNHDLFKNEFFDISVFSNQTLIFELKKTRLHKSFAINTKIDPTQSKIINSEPSGCKQQGIPMENIKNFAHSLQDLHRTCVGNFIQTPLKNTSLKIRIRPYKHTQHANNMCIFSKVQHIKMNIHLSYFENIPPAQSIYDFIQEKKASNQSLAIYVDDHFKTLQKNAHESKLYLFSFFNLINSFKKMGFAHIKYTHIQSQAHIVLQAHSNSTHIQLKSNQMFIQTHNVQFFNNLSLHLLLEEYNQNCFLLKRCSFSNISPHSYYKKKYNDLRKKAASISKSKNTSQIYFVKDMGQKHGLNIKSNQAQQFLWQRPDNWTVNGNPYIHLNFDFNTLKQSLSAQADSHHFNKSYIEISLNGHNIGYWSLASVIEQDNSVFAFKSKIPRSFLQEQSWLITVKVHFEKQSKNEFCSINDADQQQVKLLPSSFLHVPHNKQLFKGLHAFFKNFSSTKIDIQSHQSLNHLQIIAMANLLSISNNNTQKAWFIQKAYDKTLHINPNTSTDFSKTSSQKHYQYFGARASIPLLETGQSIVLENINETSSNIHIAPTIKHIRFASIQRKKLNTAIVSFTTKRMSQFGLQHIKSIQKVSIYNSESSKMNPEYPPKETNPRSLKQDKQKTVDVVNLFYLLCLIVTVLLALFYFRKK